MGLADMLLWAIADDLTSAIETVAPFATGGAKARVLPAGPDDRVAGDEDALAIGTEGRTGTVRSPAMKTVRAADRYSGAEILLKTMDSTLRGHTAAELKLPGRTGDTKRFERGQRHAGPPDRIPVRPGVWGEIEPGIPRSVLRADRISPIVTKAGGCGGPDALTRACDALRQSTPRPARARA